MIRFLLKNQTAKSSLLAALLFSTGASAQELRGVWVTNVASDVMNSKQNLAEAMDLLAETGINAIFPVVYNNGHTLYPSLVMEVTTGIRVHPNFSGRDVLADMIAEAHRVGIEVHPWLEYGFVASFGSNGGPILANHPDWAGKRRSTGDARSDDNFYWMSQANPDVQNFLIDLALEIIDFYDVDGVQLDRVRYGNIHNNGDACCVASDFGYDDAHLERYRAENNNADPPTNPANAAWKDWRAGVLADFHQKFYDAVKEINPHIMVSNAPVVFPYGFDNFMQDWLIWVEEGSVDFVAPQLYRRDVGSYVFELNKVVNQQVPQAVDKVFAGMLIRSGDYNASGHLAADFVQEYRKKGVSGGVFWFFEGMEQVAPTLKNEVFSEPSRPPFRDTLWRPKAIIVEEDDPNNTRSGEWSALAGEGRDGFYSFDGRLLTATGNSGATIQYAANIPATGYFDIYFHKPFNNQLGAAVPLKLLDGSNVTVSVKEDNEFDRGWTFVATMFFQEGLQPVLEIGTTGVSINKLTAADAVMLKINRLLSPEAIITSAVKSPRSSIPAEFRLEQNFPNPFNPSTTIRFQIPKQEYVQLRVFDLAGRLVSTLVDRVVSPGVHSVRFAPQNLASGLYFYRLKTAHFTQMRKLAVLK